MVARSEQLLRSLMLEAKDKKDGILEFRKDSA